MRLAFLSSIVPDGNPTTGFEIANEAILAGLRRGGHEVESFGFAQPRQTVADDPSTHVLGRFPLENGSASPLRRVGFVMRALRSGLPISAGKLTRAAEADVLRALDAAGPFDALVINSYQMGAAFPQLTRRPFVFVAHNVEHLSALQNADTAAGRSMRALYRRDARLLKAQERRLCRLAHHVFTLSEEDRVALELTRDKATFLPLALPAKPPLNRARRTHDVGLLGTWTWQPNVVGLEWFVTQVMPRLRGDITVAVAGATPSRHPAHKRIEWLGRVPSADRFLAQVGASALVSRGGTGVQLKTVEAFTRALACVATSASVRGVDTLPANCALADDPDDFARSLERTVDAVRAGEAKVDPAVFATAQQRAMDGALARGMGLAFGDVQASSTSSL